MISSEDSEKSCGCFLVLDVGQPCKLHCVQIYIFYFIISRYESFLPRCSFDGLQFFGLQVVSPTLFTRCSRLKNKNYLAFHSVGI